MRALCVFCGSNEGARPEYAAAARALAAEISGRGITLVYGGAKVGLMGILADTALAAGGRVVGVMPQALVAKEVAHRGLTELHEVASMHERKAMMGDLSDGFIALPGGAGTLEEVFEVWTWGQLGHHRKPVGLLNVAGFYDGLVGFLDHQAEERFMRPEHRAMLMVEDGPAALIDRFAAYEAPSVQKWISREER
ncbi:TIGR00730 family Rossman fold protein [Afifella sp. IM 167]|uniref:LOG family protein n=1 Tax=Afifella sp. IM 167 TaxID=2033586 RepID=UPI001CCE9BFE|nr:TIGR00730 family Rossman fold protein [Afifella sp. IM 167]MBZ8133132.1 TIGR00730 family Rossman fold protein [Afifella sp. IM 167]